MIYCDYQGNDVEIPSLEEHDDGEMVKVGNIADFETLVKAMGWDSVAAFEFDTGRYADDLIGKFWVQMRNVVSVEGEDAADFMEELQQSVKSDRVRAAQTLGPEMTDLAEELKQSYGNTPSALLHILITSALAELHNRIGNDGIIEKFATILACCIEGDGGDTNKNLKQIMLRIEAQTRIALGEFRTEFRKNKK